MAQKKVLPEDIALLVKKLQHHQHRTVDRVLAPYDITIVQWGALRQIALNPAASQHALAALTFNSDQAFGTLSQRLLKLKMIERHQGAGRAMVLSLTPQGEATLKQCDALVRDALTDIFRPLTQTERTQLARLLDKVLFASLD